MDYHVSRTVNIVSPQARNGVAAFLDKTRGLSRRYIDTDAKLARCSTIRTHCFLAVRQNRIAITCPLSGDAATREASDE
jgi:hypothetical protein